MTRPSILEDPWIGERGRQIAAAERKPVLEACDCRDAITPDGRAFKQHRPGCRHFISDGLPSGPVEGITS